MITPSFRTFFVSVGLLVAACAFGQSQTLMQRSAELISFPSVAQDMRLTNDQVARRDKLFANFQLRRQPLVQKIEKSPESQADGINAQITALKMDLDVQLVGILNPTQRARLLQIGIQNEGSQALLDQEVSKSLGLNSAQRSKIKEIQDRILSAQEQYQTELGEAMSKIPEPQSSTQASIKEYEAKQKELTDSFYPKLEKFTAVKDNGNKQIANLLTPAQRTKWRTMSGKPIKLQ